MEPFVRRVIRSSLLWLVIGVLIGAAMTFAPAAALAYRPAHAHANLLGFVSMMIFGVAYHVIPRFGAGTGAGDVPSAARHRDDASLHARVDHDLDPGRALPVPTGRAGRAHPIRVACARDVLDRIVDLDARDDLQRGQEPFSWIMAAQRDLRPDGVLRLRTIFDPVPLYTVMAKQGFEHWTERLAEDDWRVWFYPAAGNPGAGADARAWAVRVQNNPTHLPPPPALARVTPLRRIRPRPALRPMCLGWRRRVVRNRDAENPGSDAGVVVLDVRGLEPPEPMVHTLEALERLPEGGTLVQINVRVPRFLLPELEARGFTYHIDEQGENLIRVFVRRLMRSHTDSKERRIWSRRTPERLSWTCG